MNRSAKEAWQTQACVPPRWHRIVALIGLSLLASLEVAPASETTVQSFRCRNDLVNVGDVMKSVQAKCGEPATRERVCERAMPDEDGRLAPCLDVERWTYRPGYGQFITTMRFEDGTLVEISYGDRMP